MRSKSTLLLLSLFALLPACTRTALNSDVITDYDPALTDGSGEIDYWHMLPARNAVTNDEGIKGLILTAKGSDPSTNYTQRVELAKSLGLLRSSFNEPANLAMQRGVLAAGVAKLCNLPGGVMIKLVGPNERYSTRELVALGIFPEGTTENQTISGSEYLAVIARAQDQIMLTELAQRSSKSATSAPALTPTPTPAPTLSPSQATITTSLPEPSSPTRTSKPKSTPTPPSSLPLNPAPTNLLPPTSPNQQLSPVPAQ